MMVVSYYTPEYAGEAAGFCESCQEAGLRARVVSVVSRGSWRLNCGFKPVFLLDEIDRYDEPILWVDIDGRFRESPDLVLTATFAAEYDFACWFIPWDQMQPDHRPGGAKTKHDGLASGTMWFNNTEAARELLRVWIGRDTGQYAYEQIVLGEAWHYARPPSLRTSRLPQGYCKVFDRKWKRGEHGPVVIEHLQASRRLRRTVR